MLSKIIKTIVVIFNFDRKIYDLTKIIEKYRLGFFYKHKVKGNTVLITDVNLCHGEILPGMVEYCLKLGYQVEVLITNEKFKEKPLEMYKNKIRVFVFSKYLFKQIFTHEIAKKYKKIIFASARIYSEFNKNTLVHSLDYLNFRSQSKKTILLEHHLDLIQKDVPLLDNIMALPVFSHEFETKMVNTHFFGKFKKHKKNKKIRFLVIGNIEQQRKNYNLLLTSTEELLNSKINNFEIIVIGNGELNIENKKVAKKIKIFGRVSYKKMYKEISKSDYILSLLDKENKDHNRYIAIGTSGTFQLVYGFLKPCIIDKYFSYRHDLDDENSIIYDGNTQLANSMKKAIFLNDLQYNMLVKNLEILSKKIYNKSLLNLKELLLKNN